MNPSPISQPLDPHPANELGKGIFSPELERRLLEGGRIFACRLPPSGRGMPPDIMSSRRPIVEAMFDAFLDAGRRRRAQEAREAPIENALPSGLCATTDHSPARR